MRITQFRSVRQQKVALIDAILEKMELYDEDLADRLHGAISLEDIKHGDRVFVSIKDTGHLKLCFYFGDRLQQSRLVECVVGSKDAIATIDLEVSLR